MTRSLTRRSLATLVGLGVAICALCPACSPRVYSPPTRFFPFETPATLPQGEFGLQAEGGGAARTFGPSLWFVTARVRSGLAPQVDGSGELGVAHVMGESATDVHRNIYAGRAGVKYAPQPWLALGAGLGGGGSAGGGFIGPDVFFVFAYENPYFVPFLSGRCGFSAPIGARAVDVSEAEDRPGTDIETPKPSGDVGASVGARIPLRDEGRQVGSILFGVQLVDLIDDDSSDAFAGLGGGFEWIVR